MPNYKIVDADKLDSDLATLADSIRAKSGTSETLDFPYGMKEAVDGIQAADTTLEDGLITGTLTEYTNYRVESVKQRLFYYDKNITKVDLPNVKSIGADCFIGCTKLASVNLPSLESLENNVFQGTALVSVVLPNVTTAKSRAFSGCESLVFVDFPKLTQFQYQFFNRCTALKTIILRSPTLCVCSGANAFEYITEGLITVYVRQSLITEYQTATNWSSFYANGRVNFVAIEGSEYE